jgi:hypothetical protein
MVATSSVSNATKHAFAVALKVAATASATVTNCTIDVSRVASGNRWCSTANITMFSYCTFTGGGGHAIRLTAIGDYNIYGLIFNSFGANESTGAAILNDSGGAISLTVYGGGNTPTYKNVGASTTIIIVGLVSVTVTVTDLSNTVVENARVLLLAAAGGPMPFDTTVTITNSGTTATVTHSAHGMATNDKVQIKGASLLANNGVFSITYIDSGSYSYTMGSTPGSSPTGTIKATYVALSGLTNASGIITMSRAFSSSQPVSGRVRKAAGGTLYKTSSIVGDISSSSGFVSTIQMIPDE